MDYSNEIIGILTAVSFKIHSQRIVIQDFVRDNFDEMGLGVLMIMKMLLHKYVVML